MKQSGRDDASRLADRSKKSIRVRRLCPGSLVMSAGIIQHVGSWRSATVSALWQSIPARLGSMGMPRIMLHGPHFLPLSDPSTGRPKELSQESAKGTPGSGERWPASHHNALPSAAGLAGDVANTEHAANGESDSPVLPALRRIHIAIKELPTAGGANVSLLHVTSGTGRCGGNRCTGCASSSKSSMVDDSQLQSANPRAPSAYKTTRSLTTTVSWLLTPAHRTSSTFAFVRHAMARYSEQALWKRILGLLDDKTLFYSCRAVSRRVRCVAEAILRRRLAARSYVHFTLAQRVVLSDAAQPLGRYTHLTTKVVGFTANGSYVYLRGVQNAFQCSGHGNRRSRSFFTALRERVAEAGATTGHDISLGSKWRVRFDATSLISSRGGPHPPQRVPSDRAFHDSGRLQRALRYAGLASVFRHVPQ